MQFLNDGCDGVLITEVSGIHRRSETFIVQSCALG